jgi:hypothetical protein
LGIGSCVGCEHADDSRDEESSERIRHKLRPRPADAIPGFDTRKLLATAVLLSAALRPANYTGAAEVQLFADDFSRFKPGVLSAPLGLLNGAIQEYHYIEHRGVRTFPWRNPIVHHDGWAAGDEDGAPYLEEHLTNDDGRFAPLFVTGDPEWRDYRVEALVKPLSLEKEAGLVFRYRTSRHYYRLALEDGRRLRLAVRLPFDRQFRVSDWREIASVPFDYNVKMWYALEVSAEADRLRAAIDGKPLIDARDSELSAGIAGLTANMPARFRSFRVTTTASAAPVCANAWSVANAS